MSEQKQKIDPALQAVADDILHELPEELAATLSFKLHEGGDSLDLVYPLSLHGTLDMQLLDDAVRRHGGIFVSRGEGKSYYLVPRPRLHSSVEKLKEENKPVAPMTAKTVEPNAQASQSYSCNKVTVVTKLQSNQEPTSTSSTSSTLSTSTTMAPSATEKPVSPPPEKAVEQPIKQPSPVMQFNAEFCMLCEEPHKCDVSTEEGRFYRAMCLQVLDLQEKHTFNVLLGKLEASLEKLANRPTYSRGGQRPAHVLPTERHVDGGVSWLWDTNQKQERYEKALEVENKDSQSYVAVKKMLIDAEGAGKKGLVLEGKWHWLSQQRDYIGRKPAKDFSNSKGEEVKK